MAINILQKSNISQNSNIFNFPFVLPIVCMKVYYFKSERNNIVSSGEKNIAIPFFDNCGVFLAHHNYLIHVGDMILILGLFFRPIKKKIKKYGP